MPSIAHLTTAVESLLVDCGAPLPHGTRVRLAFWLVGILLASTIVTRRIATTRALIAPSGPQASSHERRLRRVLTDPLVTWDATYARAVRRILARTRWAQCTVILDESGHTDRLRVLTAALWYRGRAIPLAWVCWPGKVPHDQSYWTDCATLLDQVASVLPAGVPVTVLGDRAFGCPAFTDVVAAHGWDWLVRVQGQTRLRHADGTEQQLRSLLTEPGQHWCGAGQVFKNQGWRRASVVAYWRVGCKEPLLLVSSLPAQWRRVGQYRQRGAIEALFRDWKSAGWQWEASQAQGWAAQQQVVLGLAWATLLTVCVGETAAQAVLAQGRGTSMRRPWAARDSLFRLGRDALWGRLWRGDAQPIAWELAHPDARNWSVECWQQACPADTVVRMTGRVVPREGRQVAA